MRCTVRKSAFPCPSAARRWAAALSTLLAAVAAHDAHALVVEGTSAQFAWTAAAGPVAGYRVFVIRDGLAETTPEVSVSATQASVSGQVGETIAIQVAAFDGAGNQGPLSAASESVTLAAVPPPPSLVLDVSGDYSLQDALAAATSGEQVVVQLQGTTKQLLDTAPPADLAAGATWGIDQLVVGSPNAPATVRLIDAVGLDQSTPAMSLPTVTLAGLGNGDPCARDGEPGLVIEPGSRLVLGGIDLYAFDGTSCVHVNELFPGPSDPNVVAFGGGEIQLYGDLDDDGVLDPDDDCLLVANPDQIDANGNGFGNRCDFDVDGDGTVSLRDLSIEFDTAKQGRQQSPDPARDFDSDGGVSLTDVNMLANAIGMPLGPSGLDCTVDATCSGP